MTSKLKVKAIKQTTFAEKIAKAVQALVDAGEKVEAKTLLNAAKDANHLLHDDFTWDDSEAGELYRLTQASGYIRLIFVKRENILGEVKVIRKYHSLPSSRNTGAGYEDIDTILADDNKRGELLETAIKEIESFISRYDILTELAMVINPMQKIIKFYKKEDKYKVIG